MTTRPPEPPRTFGARKLEEDLPITTYCDQPELTREVAWFGCKLAVAGALLWGVLEWAGFLR